jgi:hypothetical protein
MNVKTRTPIARCSRHPLAEAYPYSRLRSDDGERERFRRGGDLESREGELSRGIAACASQDVMSVQLRLANCLFSDTQNTIPGKQEPSGGRAYSWVLSDTQQLLHPETPH